LESGQGVKAFGGSNPLLSAFAMIKLLKKKNKNTKKEIIHSTKTSTLGKVASKLGVNNKFHKYSEDYFEKDPNFIISPVDAKLVTMGKIKEGGKIISKGNKEISLSEIIGEHANLFSSGFYLNLYLSPKNRHYWRIPYDGSLISMSINEGKSKIPVFIGLDKFFYKKDFFKKAITKNASIGLIFKSKDFSFAMIPVGSLNVNGIHVVEGKYGKYKKGDIGGYFSIGSSMLLCFPKDSFETLINIGDKVKIGQNIVRIK
jgi:phosphatidylserine decarboxylase